MRPYYEADGKCQCGCGSDVLCGKRYISGHNLRHIERTALHREHIGQGQRRAWNTTRARMPLGTKRIDACGYVRVKVVVGAGSWALEHVLVMEQSIGRKIAHGEVVHHVNGDRTDNRPENLYLCRDKSHHSSIENQGRSVFREAIRSGLIGFDATSGEYGLR